MGDLTAAIGSFLHFEEARRPCSSPGLTSCSCACTSQQGEALGPISETRT